MASRFYNFVRFIELVLIFIGLMYLVDLLGALLALATTGGKP